MAADDVTAGAAGAAADAATAGAEEAAAARSGHEKRHIDDVTPGDSLGTHVRARMWTASDDEDDSAMSDGAASTDAVAGASKVAAKATRGRWTKGVKVRGTQQRALWWWAIESSLASRRV